MPHDLRVARVLLFLDSACIHLLHKGTSLFSFCLTFQVGYVAAFFFFEGVECMFLIKEA